MICLGCYLEAGKHHDTTCGCNTCKVCGNTYCVSPNIKKLDYIFVSTEALRDIMNWDMEPEYYI